MSKEEIWAPIPSFPGYAASSNGNIKSLERIGGSSTQKRKVHEKILKKSISKTISGKINSELVTLSINGKRTVIQVHRLVLMAFVGMPHDKMDGCHNDGNPLNNHLSNLRWDTRKSNMHDKISHGTMTYRTRPVEIELSIEDIYIIRGYRKRHKVCYLLSKVYGVPERRIRAIRARKIWGHLPEI